MATYALNHQRLEVYQHALEFVVLITHICSELPRGHSDLCDQLRRAANSIVCNIGEGAGEYLPAEKARFYRYARRSATEAASVLDIFERLELVDARTLEASRREILSVVRALTGLVKRYDVRWGGKGPS